MIRLDATFNAALVDELEAYIEGFNADAQALAQNVVDDLAPLLLAELQQTPGSVAYPIEWTSERQRKAFFASGGFGKGIPYQRTGTYRDSWFVAADIENAQVVIQIGNTAPYAQFVGGSLNQRSVREALQYQQRFHANTGWKLAVNEINPWLETVRDLYLEALRKQYGDFINTTVRKRSKVG